MQVKTEALSERGGGVLLVAALARGCSSMPLPWALVLVKVARVS